MREYFLSVICCAILCGILTSFLEKKSASGKLLKLIAGIVMTFTVLAPVAEVKLEDMSYFMTNIEEKAESVAGTGWAHSVDAMEAVIKHETEAYILDKARALGADLDVQVTFDSESKPCSVILQGDILASSRWQLEQMITRDLGIAKEDQIWKVS